MRNIMNKIIESQIEEFAIGLFEKAVLQRYLPTFHTPRKNRVKTANDGKNEDQYSLLGCISWMARHPRYFIDVLPVYPVRSPY